MTKSPYDMTPQELSSQIMTLQAILQQKLIGKSPPPNAPFPFPEGHPGYVTCKGRS